MLTRPSIIKASSKQQADGSSLLYQLATCPRTSIQNYIAESSTAKKFTEPPTKVFKYPKDA